MKRFYKEVGVAQMAEGFAVLLDGQPIRTPAKKPFMLPNRALAEAIAEEWRGQGEEVDPIAMPLTRFANTVLDGIAQARGPTIQAILRFGEHDLLCYRAEAPAELALRQRQWDGLLNWLADRHDARLEVTTGLNHIAQPARAIAALEGVVAACGDFPLAALQVMASITGSLVLGLAVLDGRLTAAEAFALSRLDEEYQAEKWGQDAEAEQRTSSLGREMAAAARLAKLAHT